MDAKRGLVLVACAGVLLLGACKEPGGSETPQLWGGGTDITGGTGGTGTGGTGSGGTGDTGGTIEGGTGGGGGTTTITPPAPSPANVIPVVRLDASNTYTHAESSIATRTFGFGIGDLDPETFSFTTGYPKCGTGGTLVGTPQLTGTSGSFTCVFTDGPATPTVEVAVSDNEGSSTPATQVVTVTDVAPTVSFSSFNVQNVSEGDSRTYSYSITDPGVDDIDGVSTSCGSGGTPVPDTESFTNGGGSFSCAFPDGPAVTSVSATATDSDDVTGEPGTQAVLVTNVAPTVTAALAQSSDEGASQSFSTGAFDDPGTDVWTASIDWGDGSADSTFSAGSTGALDDVSHTYADDDGGPFTATVTVTDDDGASSAATFEATVSNVAPTITSFTGSDALAGTLVEATSLFTTAWSDPGADVFDGTTIFPDGSPNLNFRAGITSVDTLEHGFAAPGCAKSVSVTIDDDDGGSDSETTTVSVGSAEFLAPMTNQHITDAVGNRSVLPVRIRVLDCSGSPIGGLSPTIELVAGDATRASDDISASISVGSVAAVDTDGIMRASGDAYAYNMAVDLPETNADYTIVIRPYGAGSSATLRHKIHAI